MHDDVVAAVRRVAGVPGWNPAPYDIVADLLRHRFGHTEEEAHSLIFEAVMAGVVTLDVATVEALDTKELCLETENSYA